jgi:hypothetical protein
MTLTIKVLSVRHTWAHALIHGIPAGNFKDIENRSYRTRHRGPLLIHASLKRSETGPKLSAAAAASLQFGGIIGIVRIVDCVTKSSSKWFEGPFGWVVIDPESLPFVAWRGQQSMFNAPQKLLEAIGERRLREYLAT